MALITFAPNTKIKSADINANFSGLANGSNDTDANNLRLTRQLAFGNFVAGATPGLTIATSANLTTNLIQGIVFVNGKYLSISTTAITVSASKDTYIDIKDDGTIVQVPVANGATTGMTLTTNSDGSPAIRIGKVVSSASAITTVVQSGNDSIKNSIYPTGAIKINNIDFGTLPRFSSYASTTPSLSGLAKVPLDSKEFDNYSAFDNVTNYRFVAPVKGVYHFTAQCRIGSAGISSTAFALIYLFVNGVEYCRSQQIQGSGNSNTIPCPSINREILLNAGDYIELYANCNEARDMGGGRNFTWLTGSLKSLA